MAGHNHRSATPKLGRRTLKGIMISLGLGAEPHDETQRARMLKDYRWALEEVVALHEKAELEMQDLARKKTQLVSAIARVENAVLRKQEDEKFIASLDGLMRDAIAAPSPPQTTFRGLEPRSPRWKTK